MVVYTYLYYLLVLFFFTTILKNNQIIFTKDFLSVFIKNDPRGQKMFPIIKESHISAQTSADFAEYMPWHQPVWSNINSAWNGGCRTLSDPDKLQTLTALCHPYLTFPELLHTQHPASYFLLWFKKKDSCHGDTFHGLLLLDISACWYYKIFRDTKA